MKYAGVKPGQNWDKAVGKLVSLLVRDGLSGMHHVVQIITGRRINSNDRRVKRWIAKLTDVVIAKQTLGIDIELSNIANEVLK